MRGDFSVIYAQGTRKAFSFLDQVTRPNRPVKCGDTGELPSCGFATWQEYALAHGQMRHQFGVVLDILGEQSRIISRECRQPLGKNDSLAFGIEKPMSNISITGVTSVTRYPDEIIRFRHEGALGHVQLGAVFRQIGSGGAAEPRRLR